MSDPSDLPNGPGAAAILAAGVGALALGLFALAGDAVPSLRRAFSIWAPTGPLSGVTTFAMLAWLIAWLILARLWSGRQVRLGLVNAAALAMLAAGLLLTFPPVMDFIQGK
jgi:hypothetical protein